eukprot:scaffold12001_cov116-Isochrysis_galbana.AAC.6
MPEPELWQIVSIVRRQWSAVYAGPASSDTLGAFLRGHFDLLQLQQELSGRQRRPPRARARGVLLYLAAHLRPLPQRDSTPEPPGPKPALHSRQERRLAGEAERSLPRRDSAPEPPGSRACCASVGWVTDGSLESPFQGLSNGARGVFCGWLFLGLRSVEFGFGLTSAVGLCHNVFWVGSCAGCALGEWVTDDSLESLSKGFPTVPGAGRLGSVSMHCEWARVPVVFRLSGRPRAERPFVWGAVVSGVQTVVWLPV